MYAVGSEIIDPGSSEPPWSRAKAKASGIFAEQHIRDVHHDKPRAHDWSAYTQARLPWLCRHVAVRGADERQRHRLRGLDLPY